MTRSLELGLSPGKKRPYMLPLNNPSVVTVDEATHLRPDDLVVGVLVAGRARAYPWWILANHHVANDHLILSDAPAGYMLPKDIRPDGKPLAPNGLFFKRSPLMSAHRVSTPVLQLTGARDQNTPPTQALEFHRALLEHGVRSVLATYPTSGHGIRGFPEVIDATTRYVAWFLEHFEQEIA